METFREKNIRESVERYFKGVDDDILKSIVMYTALGKSEEEKDALCEQINKKREEDLKYFQEKFEIEISKDTPEEVLKEINQDIFIPGYHDLTENKSDNIIIESEHGND